MTISFREFDLIVTETFDGGYLIEAKGNMPSNNQEYFSTSLNKKEYSDFIYTLATGEKVDKPSLYITWSSEGVASDKADEVVGINSQRKRQAFEFLLDFIGRPDTNSRMLLRILDFFYSLSIRYDDRNTLRIPAEVEIYIPDKEVSLANAERITNAAGEFMEALGFELETEDEPVFGSFWKRLKFLYKQTIEQETAENIYEQGRKALELKFVELPTAEQTEKLASAAKSITEALKDQEEGAVRLGALLVLKKVVDGKSKVFIFQLSSEIIILLEKQPKLIRSLNTLYEILTGDIKAPLDGTEETATIHT